MNKLKDSEEVKKNWKEWFVDIMYRIYFNYTVIDKRDELMKIMVHEIYGIPLFEKSTNFR
jgi:hypothetical protein